MSSRTHQRSDQRGVAPEAGPLPDTRVHEASEVLGQSLIDDPILLVATPRATRRTRAGLALVGLVLVRHGRRFGEVIVTVDPRRRWRPIDGVAVLVRPDGSLGVVRRLVRTLLLMGGLGLGTAQGWRFWRAWWSLESARRRAVPEAHWHLAIYGIDPSHAGDAAEVVVTTLLDAAVRRASASGVPCATTTLRAKTVLALSGHGFRVVGEENIAVLDARCWVLRR